MKKYLFLFILLGILAGRALAQVSATAVDADHVQITDSNPPSYTVNSLCLRASEMDKMAAKYDKICQQAQTAVNIYITAQAQPSNAVVAQPVGS